MQFHPDLAFEPYAIQSAYHSEALGKLLLYLQENSPFYKKLFTRHHINIHNIRSVDDLHFIPTTSRNDLQEHNWDFLCVPDSRIKEYATTRGSKAKPVTVALTANDLRRFAHCQYQSLLCADGKAEGLFQLTLPLDQQMLGGMGAFMGIRQLGAALVRTGNASPAAQWETIQRLQPDTIISVPSFLLQLIAYAHQHNIDLKQTPVQKAVCLGEGVRGPDFELNALGHQITDAWPLKLYSVYSSTGMQTVFTECTAGQGVHQQPDLIILEILNEHGDPLPPGEYGEVTVTTLGIEGMPLLRYRTGDICAYYDAVCSCGRYARRLSPVLGRKEQMIKYNGATWFPEPIFEILQGVSCLSDYVVEVFTNELELDDIRLHSHTLLPHEECKLKLRLALEPALKVLPSLVFHSADGLKQLQARAVTFGHNRFLDNRDIS